MGEALFEDWPEFARAPGSQASHVWRGSQRGNAAAGVLSEVLQERFAQDRRWGQQTWPDVPGQEGQSACDLLGIPAADLVKATVDAEARSGDLTWARIALEELAEAVEAPSALERRGELVQVAAVVAAWIADLDRKASSSMDVESIDNVGGAL